mgnify:CR=1 FL=1
MEDRSLAALRLSWPGPESPRLARAGWWESLLTGCPAPFQQACRASLQPDAPDPGDWEPLLQHFCLLENEERESALLPMVRLHLELTGLLRRQGRWTTSEIPPELDPALKELAGRYHQPLGFVRDLARFLSGADSLPAEASTRLRVALIEGTDPEHSEARIVPLLLERVEDPEERLYPHPRMAFLTEDPAFREAREAACAYLRAQNLWMPGRSVRWALEELPRGIRQLRGPSMGAAFAAGMRHLLSLPAASAPWF